MPQALNTFIIYARKDKETLDELLAQLRPLVYKKQLAVWTDGEIVAGEKWDETIKEQLQSADLILMLISKHFFTSHYIETVELQGALAQHETGQSTIIPIIVRSCVWEDYFEIGQFQALPTNGKPIRSSQWYDVDEALADVVRGIKRVIEQVKKKARKKQSSPKQETTDKTSNTENTISNKAKIVPSIDREHPSKMDWEFIQLLKGKAGYEQSIKSFLKEHPNSSFIKTAQEELAILEIPRKRENAAWKIAKKLHSPTSYETYLSQFPKGKHQQEAQNYLTTFKPSMISVQGGTFDMGSNDYDRENPIHQVQLGDFKIGKYPITVEQYLAFVNATNSNHPQWMEEGSDYNVSTGKENLYKKIGEALTNPTCPIIGISWYNAIVYCNWLSQQQGLEAVYKTNGNQVSIKHSANGFRLPSEAEWEYAARGGTKSKGYTFSGSNDIIDVAWYTGNAKGKPQIVSTKKPNELGIYDMSGNVWEWCQDWYQEDYYKESPKENPLGPQEGKYRVLRGGSWNSNVINCRVSYRYGNYPDNRSNDNGFRILQGYYPFALLNFYPLNFTAVGGRFFILSFYYLNHKLDYGVRKSIGKKMIIRLNNYDAMMKTDYTQRQFMVIFLPLLQEEGLIYQKAKNIFARPAIKGEVISTVTNDGLETQNTVTDTSSFIVKNQTAAEECYIVKGEIFQEKYVLLHLNETGFSEYQSIGKIKAIKLTKKRWTALNLPSKVCYFEAPWGQAMVLKLYDYLVSPLDYSEVYRIARKEFWETYRATP